jgi:hypothetical protein
MKDLQLFSPKPNSTAHVTATAIESARGYVPSDLGAIPDGQSRRTIIEHNTDYGERLALGRIVGRANVGLRPRE